MCAQIARTSVLHGAAVDLVDDGCQAARGFQTLDLQGGCEQAVRFREVGREDLDLTDRLGARDVLVRGGHRFLQGGQDLDVRGRLGHAHRGQRVGGEPIGEHLRVERDERGDERPLIAHDQDLGDERVGAHRVFEGGGGDVLAARRHDDFLRAARDGHVAVAVQRAQVARAEPAVFGEAGGRGLGVVVVALEDARALEEDLALVADLEGHGRQGRAHGADLGQAGRVDGDRADRLGQAVALQDGDADAAIEVGEPRGQGSAARHDVVRVAAHQADDLLVDELVGQGVLGLQGRAGAFLRVKGLGVSDRDLGRPAEDLALGAGRLRVRRVVDLLQDPRDDQEVARAEGRQVVEQVLDVRGVAEHAVAADLEDLQEAREHVGERQEEKQARVLPRRDLRHPRVGVQAQVREVFVAEDRALGRARGARRVDDGCDVVLREGVGAGEDALARGGRSVRDEGLDGLGVQGEHVRVGAVFALGGRAHDFCHGHGFGDDEVDVCVDEDVGDLVDGAGLVDGHGHEAGRPAREVEERPLVAGAAHDCDAVSGFEASCDEAGGDCVDFVVELARRDRAPRVADADLAQDQRAGRAALHAFFEQVGDRRVLIDAHQDGSVPLEGFGGRLRLCRLVVVGRGRGFLRGHACSLEARVSATGRGLSGAMILALSYAPLGWGRNAAIRAGGMIVREFVGGICKLCTGAAEAQRALAG